jgi:biopolymer transport protein ExbB
MSSSSHSVDQVIVQLQQNQALQTSPLGRILKAGIENQSMGEQFAKAQMEVTASQEIGYLERNINFGNDECCCAFTWSFGYSRWNHRILSSD